MWVEVPDYNGETTFVNRHLIESIEIREAGAGFRLQVRVGSNAYADPHAGYATHDEAVAAAHKIMLGTDGGVI